MVYYAVGGCGIPTAFFTARRGELADVFGDGGYPRIPEPSHSLEIRGLWLWMLAFVPTQTVGTCSTRPRSGLGNWNTAGTLTSARHRRSYMKKGAAVAGPPQVADNCASARTVLCFGTFVRVMHRRE